MRNYEWGRVWDLLSLRSSLYRFTSGVMRSSQEYESNCTPAKGSPRSRIPRPVQRPFSPKKNLFSPEETPIPGHSSDPTKSAISTNSSCSEDTGCPSSQLTSPSVGSAPTRSYAGSERKKRNRKRVRVHRMAESRPPLPSAGADTDLGPSGNGKLRLSSTSSPAAKRPTYSDGRAPPGRRTGPGPKQRLADLALYAPCRVVPHSPVPNNSSDASSSAWRRYHSCGDNHGIKPPSPEQYLTPLQQKEVMIRHLRSQLKESEIRYREREMEVEELRAQLSRMQEDWIEEECHRVEAQLALKEAHKEIRQLRQVVETMRSSLVEKDKGIQKYFIDINIQNRKLEALLRSMEVAQSGCPLEELAPSAAGLAAQEAREMTDSGLHISDEGVDWAGTPGQVPSEDLASESEGSAGRGNPVPEPGPSPVSVEKEVQTDPIPGPPDLQALLLHLLKLREASVTLIPEPVELAPLPPADRKPEALPDTGSPSEGLSDAGVLVSKRYWSSSFLVDLAALAVPMLPTVAWLYCTHRASTEPVYNIGVLIRGCCMVSLRSLRHMGAGV
ncbi:syntabulin-like isoform X1 [Brienomyrus brachyistius]|uniref:syntabulin-like isoform X1 n=2 Tax=Brienomyrus brachyistius TaxID=42636 RepID=UPI0020B2D1BC|nr:syntabulin-like isoform X1 [Brienomyrus brachyistius]